MTLTYFPNGKTFRTEGTLPEGCNWVTVIIGGREKWAKPRMKLKHAITTIENAYAAGLAPAPSYALVPVEAPTAMSEETKEKLRAINAEKKRVATESD